MTRKTLTILAAVALVGCQQSQTAFDQEIGRIGGFVYDLNGDPVADVTVVVQGLEGYTNADGYYEIGDILPASAIPVKFEKNGYATGYGRAELVSWELVTVNGTIMPFDGYDTFEASAGGTVEIEDVKITFAPDNILTADGSVYSGEVVVWAAHVNPHTDEIAGAPGDLTAWAKSDDAGKDDSYTLTQLVSFGMADVVIETPEGEELELDPDQPVDVTMSIDNGDLPDVYALSVGDTAPLWWFDPERSRWVEESIGGVVEAEDGSLEYEFQASHFSWYNCDQGYVPSCATGYVYDVLGFPVRSAEVTCAGSQSTSTVYTDENGLYVCTVMVGDTINVTATTTVGGRNWSERELSVYLYGYGSSAADCQPIDDLDIQVCRETGVITGGNFTASSSQGGDEYQADLIEGAFWEPKGDPELCQDPWNSLDMNECTMVHPDEVEKWVDNGDKMVDAYDDGRSVGDHLTITVESEPYHMDRDYMDGKPWYRWDNYEEDGIFEDNDNLDMAAPGDRADYMGRFSKENFSQMPPAAHVPAGSYEGSYDGGNLDIEYDGDNNDNNGVLVFVASENAYEDETCMCRFKDDGRVSVPSNMMNQLDRGMGAVTVAHIENHWVAGPDGLPIRVQLFSGSMMSMDFE
jgi:hypothetical protein